MSKVLIQPTIDTLSEYEKYADETSFEFEVVDFAYPNVLDSNYASIVERYKKECKNPSKIISIHGSYLDLYINSPDSAIKKVSEDRIIKNLEIAKELNVKYVIFHTNFLSMIEKESYYDKWVNSHVEFWKKAIEKYKITILLENIWDKNPKGLAEVTEKVNSPYLKALLDTGHINYFSSVPVSEWFERLGKNIAYIHINDNMKDGDSELSPGKGNINWKEFDSLVKKYCDNPYVCLEVNGLDNIKESAEYMKKNHIYPF